VVKSLNNATGRVLAVFDVARTWRAAPYGCTSNAPRSHIFESPSNFEGCRSGSAIRSARPVHLAGRYRRRNALDQRVQGGLMKSFHPASSALVAPPECAQKQPAGELDLALGGASILQDGPGQPHDAGWDY